MLLKDIMAYKGTYKLSYFNPFTKLITAVTSSGLTGVVKEIYCAEPRIFQTSKNQQNKVLVGLMNVLLATGYDEHVMKVVESVVDLDDEEREGLSGIL